MSFKETNYGGVGTYITEYLNQEDYLALLQDIPSRCQQYEKMYLSDPVVAGIIRAVKNPILSAQWGISYNEQEVSVTDNEKTILDYVYRVFWQDNSFDSFKLNEILSMCEYGFSVFAKMFYIKKSINGSYVSLKMPIRLQKTFTGIKKTPEDSDDVTHLKQFYSDDKKTVDILIPVKNLIIFTLEQRGNDVFGKSLLRPCYKPFIQKELTEKLKMIGLEKMAVGTPIVKAPMSKQPNDMEEIKKAIRSYMVHERAGVFLPFGWELLIQEGKMNESAIQNSINSNNTEMAMSMLSQFILLGTQGAGGAYALAQDQSDFFLNSIQYIANIVINVLNKIMIQLIDMQYGRQEYYPTFYARNINNKAGLELAQTLGTLGTSGLITVDNALKKWVRETYGIPFELEINNTEQQAKETTIQNSVQNSVKLPGEYTPPESGDAPKEVKDILYKVYNECRRAWESENPDDIENQSNKEKCAKTAWSVVEKTGWKKDSEGNWKKLSDVKQTIKMQEVEETLTKEQKFMKQIDRNETFIWNTYEKLYVPLLKDTNNRVKQILSDGYAKAKKDMKGGVEYIATSGNSAIKNDMKSKIKDQFTKLETKLNNKNHADYLMNGSLKIAQETNEKLSVKLAYVSDSEYNSFMTGHRSNIDAVVYNDERHTLETLEANFGNGLSYEVIQQQIELYSINEMNFELSVTAHPRGLFKGEVLRGAEELGITQFKMLTPTDVKFKVGGKTAASLFAIATLYDWENELAEKQTAFGVVGGLGQHANMYDYYLPVSDNEISNQKEISKEQRKRLQEAIKNNDTGWLRIMGYTANGLVIIDDANEEDF